MRPITVDVVGIANSAPIPLDFFFSPFQVTFQFSVVSGSINATLQYTADDIQDASYVAASGNWFNHANLTNKLAAAIDGLTLAVTAVRIVNTDTGTVRTRIIMPWPKK